MNEQEVVEKEEIETQEKEKPEAKEKPKFSRDDWDSMQKEKASKSGWKDFDDYVTEGGDPEKWKTADAFNLFGEMSSTLRRKSQEFEQRVEGLHKLTQAQLSAQREKLLSEREALIDEGGKSKEVKALDKQIDQLSQQSQPAYNPAVDVLNEWNANNQWVNEKSPRASHARAVWDEATRTGKSITDAIALVEKEDKKHFSTTEKPAYVPESERGRGSAGFGQRKSALTMADLTDDEKLAWKHMSHAWKDQKEFLQAVQDDRKAAGKGDR